MYIEHLSKKNSFFNPQSNIDFHIWDLPTTNLHSHEDYYEIFLVLKGPVKYLINNINLLLKQFSMSIVRPEDIHQFISDSGSATQHLNIAVRPEILKNICDIINPWLFDYINSQKDYVLTNISKDDYKFLNYLIHKINLVPINNEQQKNSEILSLLFNMLSIFNIESQSNNIAPAWVTELAQKINTVEFVNKSVQDLYNSCYYSPPVIIKAFKKYFNLTPIEYMTKIKLNFACNLLKSTNYTTLDICSRIGYDSLSHLNHLFKKHLGVTPTEYRKGSKIPDYSFSPQNK